MAIQESTPYPTMEARLLPRHVAMILDGNRRWARARGLHPTEGHRVGLAKIPEVLGWCDDEQLQYVTLWLLSPDNLERRWDELEPLFATLQAVIDELGMMARWYIRHLGDPGILPDALARSITLAVERTQHATGMVVNLAVGYGGRDDVCTAVQRLLRHFVENSLGRDQIDTWFSEDKISRYLSTDGQPDPDLVIRTSGECRLSGFMCWQTARSELYFCPALWPDFSQADLRRALTSYAQRDRRLGA
jgi:short-chain Z-isoprenyl diphosphate synthase